MPPQPPADMYLQDAYAQDPYRAQDLAAQDPVAEALYDRAAHPPPPPGTYQPQQPLYRSRRQPPYAPDPRVWAQTPAPEPEGPTRYLPYGDDAPYDPVRRASTTWSPRPARSATSRTPSRISSGTSSRAAPPPWAALVRPTPAPVAGPGRRPYPEPAPARRPRLHRAEEAGGRASGLLKSSAVMAAGTMVSRLTGFVRSALIVAALGVGLLGDTSRSPTNCRR